MTDVKTAKPEIKVEPEAPARQITVDPTDVEIIAAKSIDGDDDSPSMTFTKVFVVLWRDFASGFDHASNFTGTTQEAVNSGLRLTGLVEFLKFEDVPDGESVRLIYRAPVVLASDTDAPVNVIDVQEVWRDGISSADERTPVDGEQLSPRPLHLRGTEAGADPEHVVEK